MTRIIFYAAVIFFAYRYFIKLKRRNEENKRLSAMACCYIDYYIALKEEDKEQFKKYMDKGTQKEFSRLLKKYAVYKVLNFSKLSLNLRHIIDQIRVFSIFNTLKVRLSLYNNLDKNRKEEILKKISEENRGSIKVLATRYKIDGTIDIRSIKAGVYKNAVQEFIAATNDLVKDYMSMDMNSSLLKQNSFTEDSGISHISAAASCSKPDFDVLHNMMLNNDILAMQMAGTMDMPSMMVMDAFGSGMHEAGCADTSSPSDMSSFGMDSGMIICDMYGSGVHEFGAPDMSSPMDSGFDNNMF